MSKRVLFFSVVKASRSSFFIPFYGIMPGIVSRSLFGNQAAMKWLGIICMTTGAKFSLAKGGGGVLKVIFIKHAS